MARQETILSVFISSPSDLGEDRDLIDEIVEEVNHSLSANVGVRFVTLRWETSVTPGIGADPQTVINSGIGENYDVFVGVMGSRFGQPTPRYGSGTQEEFENAYKRHLNAPGSLQVLFYFKDVPLHPSKIDPKQLAEVNEFKCTLSSKGVLYSSYTSRDEFRKLLRIHFSEILQTWEKRNKASAGTTSAPYLRKDASIQNDPDEEPGFFDLAADIQDDFESLNSASNRMTQATEELGKKINGRTSELDAFNRTNNRDYRLFKRICAGVAQDLDEYCSRLEPESNLFSQLHARLMERTIKIVSLTRSSGNLNPDELSKMNMSLNAFGEILDQTMQHIQSFRGIVANSIRATVALNRARNRTVVVIDRLIEVMVTAKKLTGETERLVAGINDPQTS